MYLYNTEQYCRRKDYSRLYELFLRFFFMIKKPYKNPLINIFFSKRIPEFFKVRIRIQVWFSETVFVTLPICIENNSYIRT